jgi:hypothetical protein
VFDWEEFYKAMRDLGQRCALVAAAVKAITNRTVRYLLLSATPSEKGTESLLEQLGIDTGAWGAGAGPGIARPEPWLTLTYATPHRGGLLHSSCKCATKHLP